MSDIALEGSSAIEWMVEQGWSVLGSAGVFRVFADVIRSESFEMTRIWHTPAEVRLDSETSPRTGRGMVIIGMDKTQTLHTAAGAHRLHEGGIHIQNASDPVTVSAVEPVARLIVTARWDRLRMSGRDGSQSAIGWAAEPEYLRVLVTLVNAVFSSGMDPRASGFGGVERSVEALVNAVVAFREPAVPTRATSAELNLVRRAIEAIDRRSSDPSFTVALLAEELGVSKTYLHQAFGTTTMTAARRIRFRRASTARQRLDEDEATSDVALAEIARASGFGSVRTMRRAFDEVERGVIGRSEAPG